MRKSVSCLSARLFFCQAENTPDHGYGDLRNQNSEHRRLEYSNFVMEKKQNKTNGLMQIQIPQTPPDSTGLCTITKGAYNSQV